MKDRRRRQRANRGLRALGVGGEISKLDFLALYEDLPPMRRGRPKKSAVSLDDLTADQRQLYWSHIDRAAKAAAIFIKGLPSGAKLRNPSKHPWFPALRNAGEVALLRCAQTFDPNKGVPFGGYCWPRISGAMRDWVTREMQGHSEQDDGGYYWEPEPEGRKNRKRKHRPADGAALNVLSSVEREVYLAIHHRGVSVAELAKSLGCDRGNIHRTLRQAVKKLVMAGG